MAKRHAGAWVGCGGKSEEGVVGGDEGRGLVDTNVARFIYVGACI